MARSLGLATYLAFARRQQPKLKSISTPRPDGELTWLHCADPKRVRTLAKLGQRLTRQRGTQHFLLTTNQSAQPPGLPEEALWQSCPSENPSDTIKFLSHWRPDLMLWLGPELRPALIDTAFRCDVPCALLEANRTKIDQKLRWGPEPTRATLMRFTKIFAQSQDAKARLQRMLPDTATVTLSGDLSEEAPPLPVQESDLEELRASLSGRPVWLAARLQPEELQIVLSAYRQMLRLSFRTVLVVVPDKVEDANTMFDAIRDDGWRIADWEAGDFPGEDTQVLFARTTEELGLWYRLAPVSLVGSSLKSGAGGRDPLEPAALGSAILYGPSVRRYLNSYTRLASVGAARIVKDSESLTAALMFLAAPDHAAAMAHAGWQVVSANAAVSDMVIEHAHSLLDGQRAST
ncbi:3-deoxy-D-manno-octulosonic acid transferase [Shimia sp. R10_1]|uniref:3-deoxy-D-manno-octulosonic acid transferase n=1 Tax=Shimia sp. R10_1 TaxID=2821095 RepID=UPI001ADA2184|nr:glycosyltransferase N-terminal domain-containing protein [Shimia sp. R10_1]MBO9474085.1 3-deoxy-D-manno-octulosonic acid transferase [Shimia sp. R10_1]